MKAIRIHAFGGPEVLSIDQVPSPQPLDDEVVLRVRAASVNPIDYKTREGSVSETLPVTLGRDVSGDVSGTVGNMRYAGAYVEEGRSVVCDAWS
ncbi:alcohol dehydrogenase catalytic domain-containing protein [Mesorhizobium sp. ISC11]|uniref:alcohol dehydrogenase catalytic domain-containing protein n=1 Tax=Mesorhizobium sp. ISC11 TaxID=3076428 RepID=UPI00301D62C9